ncbi:hypothetical protein Ferp_2289 [Ferroglobus placidus DSM 10642]|uniref:Rubrerythrin diiron-binding domain-containing protein n=1 Tax=Ferroglobus placidus (strain DSM 10642 / AEDII12DO) TaxID=589924 RepID=D3S1E9_FERPA|nr:hypothetical protein [Ferroglobus placidus]ADC66413.1 hypothetical protein Ferp_2289 [Ferroglobus placidus DSM 10642]
MASDEKVLARLLARAYIVEIVESQIISEVLSYIFEDEIWDRLFRIIVDNELHRLEIERIVRELNYDVSKFREYAEINFTTERCKDFSEELVPQIMEEIIKLERWMKKYYEKLSELTDDENVREKIRKLVEWEEKHIKLLEDLKSEFF